MKKVLVINNKYKVKGGEDSNILDELNLLQNRFQVEFIEFDNTEKINLSDLISLFINSNFRSNNVLKLKIKSFNPDIVYVHNLWFKGNLGILKLLKKNKIKTIVKVHNFRYYCANTYLIKKHLKGSKVCYACNLSIKSAKIFNKYYPDSLLRSLLLIKFTKKYLNILKSQNLRILTITNFHQEFMIASGISKEKLNIYLNPIEFKNLDSQINLTDSNIVIYAGRLTKEKGIIELLDSWKNIERNTLKLKIFGTGNIEQVLRNKYSSDNVEFCGEVENATVINEIANARAVITSTKMFEGQPRLLCEASSLGIPSVFPSFGGMEEFFPNNYAYSFKQFDYADMKNKILLLLNNEVLNYESKRVKEFLSSKLDSNQLLDSFEKILEQT